MSKEIHLLDEQLVVDEPRCIYNDIRKNFKQVSEEGIEEFKRIYETYKNIDDVFNEVLEHGNSIINFSINKGISLLLEKGIYDYSIETLREEYIRTRYYGEWINSYDKIAEKYIKIYNNDEMLKLYKSNRNAARKVFKKEELQNNKEEISKENQGSLLDTIANIGKDIFDFSKESINSISMNREKKDLFEDEETFKTLSKGLYNASFNIHYLITDILIDSGENIRIVTKEDSDKVKILLSNIKNDFFPDNDKKDVIFKMIYLDPYNEEIYHYIFDNYGDIEGELTELTNFFNIDIKNYKLEKLKEYYEKLDISTEDNAKESKEKLIEKIEVMNMDFDNPIIHELNDKLINFDREYRTVNGYIYDTREAAEEERIMLRKINKLENLYDSLPKSTEEDAFKSKEKLIEIINEENIELRGNNHVIIKMDGIIEELDKEYRTVNNIIFSTRDEADLAKKEVVKIEEIMSHIDMNSTKEIELGIQKIEYEIDTKIKNKYIDKLKLKKLSSSTKDAIETGVKKVGGFINSLFSDNKDDKIQEIEPNEIDLDKVINQEEVDAEQSKDMIDKTEYIELDIIDKEEDTSKKNKDK